MKHYLILFIMILVGVGLSQCNVSEPNIDIEPAMETTAIPPSATRKPSNTPSFTATLTASTTPTPTITLSPTPTSTVLGGYSGKYLLVSTDVSEKNHQLSLHNANGELVQIIQSFPIEKKIVNDYGATQTISGFGDVKWSPNGLVYAVQVFGNIEIEPGQTQHGCFLYLYSNDHISLFKTPIPSR